MSGSDQPQDANVDKLNSESSVQALALDEIAWGSGSQWSWPYPQGLFEHLSIFLIVRNIMGY